MARRRRLSDADKDLKRLLDRTLAETVVAIESRLQSEQVSPTDTSRFRSNWMVSESTPDRTTTENTTPSPRAGSLRIDSRKEYWITNSLPYATRLAIEGSGQRVVSKPTTWFSSFRNDEIPKIVKQATQTVKDQEGF